MSPKMEVAGKRGASDGEHLDGVPTSMASCDSVVKDVEHSEAFLEAFGLIGTIDR